MTSNVEHPKHYQYEGVEVWDIVRTMSFNLGNAVKYIARAGRKDKTTEIEDLQKAIFCIQDELANNKPSGDGDDLENEWGEKVYRLGAQMSMNRQEALEYVCMGTANSLQYGINFLDREIEKLELLKLPRPI